MSYSELCPWCFCGDPTPEHLSACPREAACINCGFVLAAHGARARWNARALGFAFLSCNLFTPYDGKPVKARKMKGPNRQAAGAHEGKKGRRARAALRNITKPRVKAARTDFRGRKLPGG